VATQHKAEASVPQRLPERQAGRWALQRAGDPERIQPCIAISRLPGAGGGEVGRRVAEWLDYGFFPRAVLGDLARDLGPHHWLLAGLDEDERSRIERDAARPARPPAAKRDGDLDVARAIATLGLRGSAVLLGGGAAFQLSPDRVLRVLVLAPRERRLSRFAKRRGIASDEAAAALAAEEEGRAERARQRFGVRYDDPTVYDLVVNTGGLDYEAAASVVIAALRRRFPT
jgi:cytidylate kinase